MSPIRQGNYSKKNEPKTAKELHDLGLAQYKQGNNAEAATLFEQTLKLDPKRTDDWILLGSIRYKLHDYPGAISASESAIATDPESPKPWTIIGISRNMQEQFPEAIQAFEQSLALDSRDSIVWLNLGLARESNDELEGAVAAFQRALQLERTLVDAWVYLGESRECLKDFQGATRAYRRGLKLDSRHVNAWSYLARVLKKQGDLGASLYCYDQASRLGDTESKKKADDMLAEGIEMVEYSIDRPANITVSSLLDFSSQALMERLGEGKAAEKARASLALGAIHARSTGDENDIDASGIEKALTNQLHFKAGDDESIIKTMATIGLGFMNASTTGDSIDAENLDMKTDDSKYIKEGIAVLTGLGTSKEALEIIGQSLNDQNPNVVFGGAVGACLRVLEAGPFNDDSLQSLLVQLVKSEYYDLQSAGLLALGFQAMASKTGTTIDHDAIDDNAPYEAKIANVLGDCFALSRAQDGEAAIRHLSQYTSGTGFQVMATIPAYGLLLLARGSTISKTALDSAPLEIGEGGSIYDDNGLILLLTIIAANAEPDVKAYLEGILEKMRPNIKMFSDTRLVHSIYSGVQAVVSDRPRDAFLDLINFQFAPVIGIDEPDWDEDRLAMGSLLGMAMGLYLSHVKAGKSSEFAPDDQQIWTPAGLHDSVVQAIAPLLNQALQGSELMQKAANIACVAAMTSPRIFAKYLFITAMYELAGGGDYPYLKPELLVLSAFVIFYNTFVLGLEPAAE